MVDTPLRGSADLVEVDDEALSRSPDHRWLTAPADVVAAASPAAQRSSPYYRRRSSSAVVRDLRIGVLGASRIAVRRMLPAMRADDRITVAAIASRDPGKAAAVAAQFGAAAVPDYEALLARDDIDAVYVPLPAALHVPWTRAALAAGKHVLVEKPLAIDAAGARAVADLAARRSLTVMESFAFLHHPQHSAVQDAVAAGELGELRAMTADFGFPPLPADDIRYDPELGGGALLDAGVYTLRAAQLFLGPQLSIVGATLQIDEASGVDVAGAVLAASPGGVTAQLGFGFTHSYRSSYTLWGSAGRLTLNRAFAPPPTLQPVIRIERQNHVRELTLPADDQFARIAARFAAAVLDGEDPAPYRDAAVRQAELVDAVQAGATRTRRTDST